MNYIINSSMFIQRIIVYWTQLQEFLLTRFKAWQRGLKGFRKAKLCEIVERTVESSFKDTLREQGCALPSAVWQRLARFRVANVAHSGSSGSCDHDHP